MKKKEGNHLKKNKDKKIFNKRPHGRLRRKGGRSMEERTEFQFLETTAVGLGTFQGRPTAGWDSIEVVPQNRLHSRKGATRMQIRGRGCDKAQLSLMKK